MAEKKKISNKGEKKAAPSTKAIDWESISEPVDIVGAGGKHLRVGQDYKVTKEIAKLLINKGFAKLA